MALGADYGPSMAVVARWPLPGALGWLFGFQFPSSILPVLFMYLQIVFGLNLEKICCNVMCVVWNTSSLM